VSKAVTGLATSNRPGSPIFNTVLTAIELNQFFQYGFDPVQ